MRLIPLLLVSVSLVLAGCSKEEDPSGDNTGTTTTTTTTPTGGATTTTTPPTSGGGAGNNTGGNTTTPRAPVELCNVPKDFTGNTPTPPEPTARSSSPCGTPAAGYTKINATVTWTTATAVPASASPSNPTVILVDSAGTAVGNCAGPTGPVQAAVTCTIAEAAIVPGEYVLQFEGTGNLRAAVSVMVS